jgi:hypothetical protein
MDAVGYFVINEIALDRTLFNPDIIKGPSVRLESLLQQVCTDIFYTTVRDSCKKRNIVGRIPMFGLPFRNPFI